MNPFLVEAFLKSTIESLLWVTSIGVTFQGIAIHKIKEIRLKRDTNHCQNKILFDTPFIDLKTVEERKRELSREKLRQLEWYVKKLERYTSEENLKSVYRNLKTLKVERNFIILIKGVVGRYNPFDNWMQYALKSSIGHEFLHMASRYYDPKSEEENSGFCQRNESLEIGLGLTEGYTELLASRIYNKNNKVSAYHKEVRVARLFELFFDNPKEMENYYFNHNLPGFIHHMEQYAPREEIIKLLQEMDEMLIFSKVLSPISIYKMVNIEMKLYEWFRLKNKNPQKLAEFEQIIQENMIASCVFKKQKIKLQRTFQKGKPVFDTEQSRILNSDTRRKIATAPSMAKENKTNEKQQAILKELLPYQKLSFVNLCSEVFQVPMSEINILQATKLYCLMTNIDFVSCDRKVRNAIARQVQTLILPENEKTPLEKRTGEQLQKKLNSTWNIVFKNEETKGVHRVA